MVKIVLFSEDRTLHPLLSSALGRDFHLSLEPDADGIVSLLEAGSCDVMILDLYAQRGLAERLESARRLIASDVPAIVMAEDGLRSTAFELVQSGAFGYCRRPPSVRDLKTLLTRAYETSSLRQQLISAQQRLEDPGQCDRLIGSAPPMQRVYQLVRSVTNLNAAVLITGESGTGKELIARALHNLGDRASKPFVAVSCGAIPETLIEAELFGHEKGAFTGTVGAREGYFEQAGDGTLFLDEIGDLSLFTQVKLLRVLQQMEFCRLGSSRLIPLRARLIFATHQDLDRLVAEGKFRQDLYYRINVMRIESPALRERPGDVSAIARHFLRQYAQAFQKPMEGIEPEAMELLRSYSWPGNVRELENVMQRAIILAPAKTVRAADLSLNLSLNLSEEEDLEGSFDDVVDFSDFQPSSSFERQIRDYKIKLALNAVRENNGNKTLAARSLCISRAYLHRLIRLAEPGTLDSQDDNPVFNQGLRQSASA